MMDCHDRKTAQAVTLYFDTKPISVNAMSRTIPGQRFARSILSADYRKLKVNAGRELEAQKPPCVPGPYGCRIAVAKGCRHDIDNVAKAFLDLLAAHNVTDNDRNCQRLEIWRSDQPQTMIQILSTRDAGE